MATGQKLPFRLQVLVFLAKFSTFTTIILPLMASFPFLRQILPWKTTHVTEKYGSVYALVVDTFLLLLFGLQHSAMNRLDFLRKLSIPEHRSATYSAAAGITVMIAFLFWQDTALDVIDWELFTRITPIIFFRGVFVGFGAIFAVWNLLGIPPQDDLLGVRALKRHFYGKPAPPPSPLRTNKLYSIVRHPEYSGVMAMLLFSPVFCDSIIPPIGSQLLLSFGLCAYVMVGVLLEERSLERTFGDAWRRQKEKVPMLINLRPWRTIQWNEKEE